MDNSKKYLSIAFVVILVVVVIVSALGIWMLGRKPVILQGQIEATEIRISGKLPGRIDTFLVEEGQNVAALFLFIPAALLLLPRLKRAVLSHRYENID